MQIGNISTFAMAGYARQRCGMGHILRVYASEIWINEWLNERGEQVEVGNTLNQ